MKTALLISALLFSILSSAQIQVKDKPVEHEKRDSVYLLGTYQSATNTLYWPLIRFNIGYYLHFKDSNNRYVTPYQLSLKATIADVAARLRLSDTASMLAPYLRTANAFTKVQADGLYRPLSYVPSWTDITGKPTTFAPAAHDHSFASLTAKPTSISGYGITDAFTQSQADGLYRSITYVPTFASLLSKPTTLGGYGITDAYTKSESDGRYLQAFTEVDPKRVTTLGVTGMGTKTITLGLADGTNVSGTFTDQQGSGGGGVDNDADSLAGQPGSYYASVALVATKVDKVTGKGLSTEDYTSAEKTKLAGVAAGATNVTNTNQLTNGAGFIVGNPSLYNTTASYKVLDSSKLAGIAPGATNVTNNNQLTNGAGYIAGNAALHNTTASYKTGDSTKLSGIATGAEVNVNADWNAVSGDAQILNKPTIPAQFNPIAGTNVTLSGTYPNITFNATGGSGGAGGDVLSALTQSEVSITAATTLTSGAFGKMHVCSGTSSDYTITLPAVSGNAGKIIGFRMAAGLTKLVTLDADGSETIDVEAVRIMWAGETAILLCDGTTWVKIAGKSIPFVCSMSLTTGGTMVATWMLIPLNNVAVDNSGLMASTSNNRIIIRRPGRYSVSGVVGFAGDATGGQSLTGELTFTIGAVDKNTTSPSQGRIAQGISFGKGGGYSLPNFSRPVTLAANDYLRLVGIASASGSFYYAGEFGCSLSVSEIISW